METIGKYRLREKIGEGGTALVYRAVDKVTGREVALKTLSRDLADDHQTRSRFFLEAQLAGRLSHPNVVTIYDLGEDKGRVFIAMEYLRGETLRRRIARSKPSVADSLRILTDAAGGLAHAHHQGITHRDIKPSNIFLCDSGQVKILDFGLAHINSSNLTKTGQVLGTPDYMSPEQVLGRRVDHRSDIFSLGCVGYELFTGHKPFAGRFIEKVLFKIVYEDPKLMESYDPSIPKELGRIVRTALAKRPKDRFQSVVEFLRELARLPNDSKIDERESRSATDEDRSSGVETRLIDQVLDTLSTGRDSSKKESHRASSNLQSELSELLLSTLGPFGMEAVSPS
jgi:serine/threonine-protein kinase